MRPTQGPFPVTRLRRTRATPAIRALVAQNTLTPADLIWPVFVRDGDGVEEPVPSMPGVLRRSVDRVVEAAREAQSEAQCQDLLALQERSLQAQQQLQRELAQSKQQAEGALPKPTPRTLTL